MKDEELKLPGKKKKKKSKAPEMYGRHGRVEIGEGPKAVLPVGLDPDVMQQLVNEAVSKPINEQLQEQLEQSVQLPLPGAPV